MDYGVKKINLNFDMTKVKRKSNQIASAVEMVGGNGVNHKSGILSKKYFKLDLD